jgi:hypothetical protein
MKRVLIAAAVLIVLPVFAVLAHLALIEVGREVATLRTERPDGTVWETRLWIVDDGAVSWLHSAGAEWAQRFAGDPVVEVERGGRVRKYRAHAVPGPHPRLHQLLREKYGLADRWVRFIGPDTDEVLPVRLDPLEENAAFERQP